ncbi:hypothetical protein F0344_24365 [Streptomyces finlayi]|uniref:Uncharacterized protein n=1 Tax=Streptomyces finlayi TaxID=67296 RepID=A0A7G7BPP7_9ACTN|nr:hypothetical protein [Streptomyces finlayi]QNE77312.1 hypothetical protein F0344_24365 [Streptomyces finlayi]
MVEDDGLAGLEVFHELRAQGVDGGRFPLEVGVLGIVDASAAVKVVDLVHAKTDQSVGGQGLRRELGIKETECSPLVRDRC